MEQGLTTKEMVDALDETESKITASRMRLYEQERMDPDTWKEKILARKGRAKGGSPQRRKINKPSQEEKQPQAAEHDEEENTIKNYVLDASSKESDEDKDHISVDELVGDAGQTADLTVAEVEKTMHSDIKRTRNDRESHERLFNTKIRALKLIGFGNDEIADLYHIKPWKVLRAVQQLEKNGEIRKFYPGREEGKRLRNIERKSRPLSEAGLDATQIAEKTGEDVEEVQQALMRLSIRAGARKKRG